MSACDPKRTFSPRQATAKIGRKHIFVWERQTIEHRRLQHCLGAWLSDNPYCIIGTSDMTRLIAIVFSVVIAASSASALLPYEYEVMGVAKTDGLNVRDDPHRYSSVREAKIVGSIPWNAKGVLGTGASVRIGKSRWIEIRYRNVRGWVNSAFMKRVSRMPDGKLPKALNCSGTEPFWSLTIRGKSAIYAPADGAKTIYSVARIRPAQNRRDTWVLTLTRPGAAASTNALLINSDRCSDAMSEMDYPFDLYLIPPTGQPLQGCCTVVR